MRAMRTSWIVATLCAGALSAQSDTRAAGSAEALRALEAHLSEGGGPAGAASRPYAATPLTKADAASAAALLVKAHLAEVRTKRAAAVAGLYVERDGVRMRYWSKTFGDRKEGRSLWISMHGGGSVPADQNDGQWNNQKRLYRPAEGVYVAPRAPTDAWNMWHVSHIDGLFDLLIETLVATEGVDPDRVYLMGYSAGGDGAYQLAPRMADRFAAAAMMAGHPGDASPLGLRNLPFALYMGGKDKAFKRNDIAREWKKTLAGLATGDEGGYPHRVEVLESKGHWMGGEDAAILPWMAERTRDLRPTKIVWRQDDVLHGAFYWLGAPEPQAYAQITATRAGQTITLSRLENWKGAVAVRLDDRMVDLDRDVVVRIDEREVFRGRPPRTIGALCRTLRNRGDIRSVFSAEILVQP